MKKLKDGELKSSLSSFLKAYNEKNKCIIECNKKYFRPAEVDTLKGDFSKARRLLGWRPKRNIMSLIKDMISYELRFIND